MSTATIREMVVKRYFNTLTELLHGTVVTTQDATSLTFEQGIDIMPRSARETRAGGNKIMFVGNGGSAGISSHLGIDYSKSGGLRARAFNDLTDLTCRSVARLGGGRIVNRQRATPCRRRQLLRRIQRIRMCRGCALVALPRRPRHRDGLARQISPDCCA